MKYYPYDKVSMFAYDRYVVFENAQIKRSSSTWMCGNVIKNETNTKELKNEKFSKDDNILTLHLTSHLILLPSDYYLIDSKFSFFFFLFCQIFDNRNSCISTYMYQNRNLIFSNSIYLIFSRFTALIIFPSNILFEILKCIHSINICFLAHLDFSEHILSGVLAPACLYTWIFSSSYFRLFENYCTSIVVDNI